MKLNSLLLITHCFPTNIHEIPGNFLYDFCLYLRKHRPELKISILVPKYSDSAPNQKYLRKVADKFYQYSWKGSESPRRLAEYSFKNFKDLFYIKDLLSSGKKVLGDILENNNFDHVLACWTVPSAFIAYKVCKKYGTPYSVWSLGSDVNIYGNKFFLKSIQKKVLNSAEYSFVNNYKFVKDLYLKTGKVSQFLATNRIICSKNEIENNFKFRKKYRYVFVGRLEKVKGPHLLIDSFLKLQKSNWELQIVGDGSLRNELESRVADNNLDRKIKFYGFQDKEFIKQVLLTSDYLVISSFSEGMPVVFWEAMQCGVPVLSTPVGDIPFYINKYNVGRVTEKVDTEDLAKLISFTLEFPPLHHLLERRTIELAQMISIKNSAENFIRIIERENCDNNFRNQN